jgi:hypothetical protein
MISWFMMTLYTISTSIKIVVTINNINLRGMDPKLMDLVCKSIMDRKEPI